jgi:diguanylate cyclase (GGDEF)-like protein
MANTRSNPPVGALVAGFLFLVVVAANAVSFPYLGTGSWWMSGRFWSGRVATLIVAGAGAWWIRERAHRRREDALERAVLDRTQTLERERFQERESNRMLEMLVSNQPLGTVLDTLARLTTSQCPTALCVILMKRPDGYQVVAAPDLPGEWLEALQVRHAVPFELWRKQLETRPHENQAWRIFTGALSGPPPAAIHSWPIGNPDTPHGALLLFYREAPGPGESDPRRAEAACRIARLALEHSRLYDDLLFQGSHDGLTGLPNRMLYEERLDESLNQAALACQKVAVLFIDLDRFKEINDGFGHRVGDLLLGLIARRLKTALGPGDTVARIGGDEFTIVLNDVKDAADASKVATLVLEAIREPIVIDGHHLKASASVGIAIFPDDAKDSEQLERAADAAMYHAKDLGRDRAEAFATRNETLDRARMEREVRIGLRLGYFVVYYQPKVGVDRKVVGFEALVRMNHPEHGLIPPASFIAIAEASGLIVPLGAWVLEEVCRQVAEWESRGLGQIPVAVNVSPVQICLPDFANLVQDCLSRYAISPANLELELTEGLLIRAAGVAQEQLRALRKLGVQLSIDDFGTGYSSLSYLHRLQIDSIKLDRSFVQSIDTDELARRLVQAMIAVAHGLGLSVVAEGVETEAQRTALIAAGCPLMQGFLFARPQLPIELEDLLRLNTWTTDPPKNDPTPGDLVRLTASMQLKEIYGEPISV